ncbi:RNA polymerase sigma factor [Microbacterium pygmaeum]|uniref:RNA polymerase sigma-70 factor, ECF subfamily n=1 Tax=Microbacterium pygmaeum TaxID=370764 RepID=A0A1G8DF34_9MICO|nr:sigma-70 family RNA polymerase sigma factor [Microbacterium pygmaeum]SDH56327.1 RNA polymerase sigma-70 factor, ECF subfamily [Microbacterium pygmaeum]
MGGRNIPPALRDWVELVVEDNADDLLRYFRRRVTHPEDAADMLGRVLLAVWEKASRLPTTEQDARMWCFGIARNVLREHYRYAAKQLALADGLRDHLRASAPPQNGADTVVEEEFRSEAIRQAVRALDDRSRELLLLVHWDGFSIAGAARILSINASTARTRYTRALRRLEKQLDRDDDPESRPATFASSFPLMAP